MKFWIDNHGCAKNQVDGEEISTRLENAGHSWVDSAAEAELVIVNTCGFIESAKRESVDAIMSLKAAYPEKKILVAGCLSQRYSAELALDMAEADGIAGNTDFSAIVATAEATVAGKRPVAVSDAESASTADYDEPVYCRERFFDFAGTVHVKITEGCSNRCSFCAIPLIRGSLRSRKVEDIVEECRGLVARGIHELVLVGQDLGSFGKDRYGRQALPELLAALSALPAEPVFRVRILYIHPDNFPLEILDIMARDSRLIPYFDIPFQHAAKMLLRAMNRRGDEESYLGLITAIRERLPDCMVRSTFLVGFPGETEEDFATLRDFQDRAGLDWLGTFAYSREEGTPSYSMKGRVAKKTAEARRRAIEEAQVGITARRLARFIGSSVDVVIEEKIKGEELCIGRAWMQTPDVDGLTVVRGTHAPGSLVRCTIVALNGVDFEAVPTRAVGLAGTGGDSGGIGE